MPLRGIFKIKIKTLNLLGMPKKANRVIMLLVMLVLASTMSIFAQNKSINGVVTSQSGEPIIGATVLLKGSTSGTITDINGRFEIPLKEGVKELKISYLGFYPQEISIEGKNSVNVVLQESSQDLDAVVVVGYGTVRRRDLTGSVSSIGSKDISALPVSNAVQALAGKIAGVSITSVDGRPDAEVKIRVRGGGSITQSNSPLYIVDGFPVSTLSDIPASQIESIDILKDASSTAIYGARGANGVVIVTTKSPKGKVTVSYDGYAQWKTMAGEIEMLDPYNFALINWEYTTLNGNNLGFEKAFAVGNYKSFTSASGTYNNPDGINAYKNIQGYNWLDKVTRDAFSQSHNVTLNGGNDNSKYSISYNYVDDEGLKINSGYKRQNILGKIQQDLTKKLKFYADASMIQVKVLGKNDDSRLTDIMKFTPVQTLGDTEETSNTDLGLDGSNLFWRNNPESVINDIFNQSEMTRLRGNASLSWEMAKGLTFRTELGGTTRWRVSKYFVGAIAKDTKGQRGGDATLTKSQNTGYKFANTLNWDVKKLGEDHKLNLLVGQEINSDEGSWSTQEGKDYPISFDANRAFAMMGQYNGSTTTSISSSGSDDVDRLSSFFGRVNYTLKDRYLFTATLRADGSSNFSKTHQWGYFPAAAVAWRISSEPFMEGTINYLDNLKLRLSYGEAGNDRISSGLWKTNWSAKGSGYAVNNTVSNYYVPSSDMMINPDLKWETTITRNLGLDFGFWKNRIYGTVDAYWNTTKDLLLVKSIPAFTGYTTQMDNVGQTRNIGLEFSLGGDFIRTKDWNVSANFNISFNKNKIEALADNADFVKYSSGIGTSSAAPVNDYLFEKGGEVGVIRGYVADGFYTTEDFNYDSNTKKYTLKDGVANSMPILAAVPGMTGVYPGMMKLKKVGSENNATTINEADDCVEIGNANPVHIGGINLSAGYKNFDVMAAFSWSYGNDIYNYTRAVNSTGGKSYNRNFTAEYVNRYKLFDLDAGGNLKRVTDPAELAALNANATTYYPFHEFRVLTSDFIEDGSFLRLNNLTLGYSLPEDAVKALSLTRVRFYATGTNLFLLTKYSGVDPEVDSGSGRNSTYPTPGMDYGTYPRARTLTVGVNLTF